MKTRSSAAVTAAKHRAQRLANRLENLGVKLTRGQSLEGLAAAEGFEDWNRLAAAMNTASAVPQSPFSVLLSNPGDGTSVVYRFHALNVLDQFPQDHVLMVSPYGFSTALHCQRWNELEERLIFAGPTTVWPSLEKVKGKVLLVMPPPNFGTSEELSQWLEDLMSSWKRWKGHGRTRAFFGLDVHRYEPTMLSGLFANPHWPLEVRLFAQTVDTLKALAKPGLEVLALTKYMAAARRAEVAQLEANVTLLTGQQPSLTDEALGTFEGLVRFIASPLVNPSKRSSDGPLGDRLLSFLQEETLIYKERQESPNKPTDVR